MTPIEELICFAALIVIACTELYMCYLCPVAWFVNLAAWIYVIAAFKRDNWQHNL